MIDSFIEEIKKEMELDEKELYEIKNMLIEYENNKSNNYVIDKINELFKEWKKVFKEFNIPNCIFSISVNDEVKHYVLGNVNKETIFDIASITKLYTEVIILKIIDRKEYNISLNSKISDITNLYPNLDSSLTILDLLSFNNTYKTNEDIRQAQNRNEALKRLRTSYIVDNLKGYYLYTDIPLMILTDVLENYTKLSYKELFEKYIINELNLKNTFLILNEEDKSRYVGYDKNTVNDPKANIMGGYYGHAGVKTTCEDIITFINSIFTSFSSEIINILTKKTTTRNIKYDKEGKLIEKDLEYNKHLLTRGIGLIGNLNIAQKDEQINDYKASSLASTSIFKKGFAVQGSTRVHAETSLITINNKQYITSISILLDITNQYENAKKYENKFGKIITKESKCELGNYYMMDPRSLLPYSGIYKKIINIVSRYRLIKLYCDYKIRFTNSTN